MPNNNPTGKGGFQKGQSGNPNGRPKKRVEEKYVKALYSSVKVADWKKIVLKAVEQAQKGDPAARNWLSKYVVGNPEQVMKLVGADEGAPVITFNWIKPDETD